MSENIIKKISCGTFLVRKIPDSTKYELLMIFKDYGDKSGWVLPKGGVEEGETHEQTAVRETREETGVKDVIIIREIGSTTYPFEKEGQKFEKMVVYFLAITPFVDNQVLIIGTTEHEKLTQKDTKWIPFEKVSELLLAEWDREIFLRIEELLNT